MFSKAIMTTLTVSILSTSMLAPVRALADSVSTQVPTLQRNASGVVDHRKATDGGTVVRDHRTKPDIEVVPADRGTDMAEVDEQKDCRLGASKLFKMGYRSIYAVDCSGSTYHYVAMDDAALFAAEMNAYSGEIAVIFVGIIG